MTNKIKSFFFLHDPILRLAEIITRTKRYRPEVKWSNGELFVSDFFRILEQIFGRKIEDKPRVEQITTATRDEFGNINIKRDFFTLEALACHIEGEVRLAIDKGSIGVLPTLIRFPRIMDIFGMAVSMGRLDGMLLPILSAAYDASAISSSASANSLTFSQTNGSSVTILVAGLGGRVTPSGATYNGTSMTSAMAQYSNGASNINHMYYLGSPSTGAHNVVASFSSTGACAASVISLSGSDASVSNTNSATGNSTTPSVAVTAASGSIVIDFCDHNQGDALTETGTGQTKRQSANPHNAFAASTTTGTGGSTTASYSCAGSNLWAIGAVEVRAATIKSVSALSSALTLQSSTRIVSDSHSPSALSLSLAIHSPVIVKSVGVSALALSSSIGSVALSYDFVKSVSSLDLTLAIGTHIASYTVFMPVSSIGLSSSVISPSISSVALVAARSLSSSLLSPSISVSILASVATLSVIVSINSVSFLIGRTVSASALAITSSLRRILPRWMKRSKPTTTWTPR